MTELLEMKNAFLAYERKIELEELEFERKRNKERKALQKEIRNWLDNNLPTEAACQTKLSGLYDLTKHDLYNYGVLLKIEIPNAFPVSFRLYLRGGWFTLNADSFCVCGGYETYINDDGIPAVSYLKEEYFEDPALAVGMAVVMGERYNKRIQLELNALQTKIYTDAMQETAEEEDCTDPMLAAMQSIAGSLESLSNFVSRRGFSEL